MSALVVALALICDRVFGEPRHHPLVLFGMAAGRVEVFCRSLPVSPAVAGAVGWGLLILPPVVVLWCLHSILPVPVALALEVLVLYICLAHRSLGEHADSVYRALQSDHLPLAREELALMVSRDTAELDVTGVAAGAVESVLENGSDAVIASMVWYFLLGPVAVLAHRLANTLDAMWGYRSASYLAFGRCAARVDDVFNWVPARVCALAYSAVGHSADAWRCWRTQAGDWDSPNAGPVMAAGAGAIGVRLGGPASYRGAVHQRPALGTGVPPAAPAIQNALTLLLHAVLTLLLLMILWELCLWMWL